MSLIKWVDFPLLGDERGSLIALEQNKEIPFDLKRVYYIFGTKESVQRGFHAHKKLKQIAVCVAGHCKIILDDGIDRTEVTLDSPEKGLLVEESVWREMHGFSNDCVLLVLASDYYDESDYIRDYTEFKSLHQ